MLQDFPGSHIQKRFILPVEPEKIVIMVKKKCHIARGVRNIAAVVKKRRLYCHIYKIYEDIYIFSNISTKSTTL